ncbi:MAG: chromosomal replication initiator protein DnaA [Verrucomicrobiota bacterium]
MTDHSADTWTKIKGLLKARVNEDTFKRWFEAVEMESFDTETVHLKAPNLIYKFWIETNYVKLLDDSIQAVLKGPRKIEFSFTEEDERAPVPDVPVPAALPVATSAEPTEPARSSRSTKRLEEKVQAAGLNLRYRFDSYVVGEKNSFACAACQAVSEKPAVTYNPLFIFGGAGLGKTHLMHAIGQSVLERKPRAKVLYVSSERFTNEFIDSIRHGEVTKFRQRYRQVDVLLIDDIQFFGKKEKSQEEFFHTFNALTLGHKQVVMSCDRPASEIEDLQHRLITRCEWGLTAHLLPPDQETRIAILQKKMAEWQVRIDRNIIEYLADKIRDNVRRLEGALVSVASYVSLGRGSIQISDVEHLIKDILKEDAKKPIRITKIQKKVAEHYDIRLADMTSRARPANIAQARQVAMYLTRELTNTSYKEIGEAFGGRDHGTVIHACNTIRKKMASVGTLKREVDLLNDHLRR